jgi:hypothetical protein
MNDLKTLHDAWGAPDAPSHTAYAHARAALLAHARADRRTPARRRLRRPGMRLAAAGASALAVAGAVIVVQNLDGGRSGSVVPGVPAVPVAAAEVLHRAAAAAQQKPFTAPRPDQWIYIEERFTSSDGPRETRQTWHRASGEGMAWMDHGKLRFREEPRPPKDRPGLPDRPSLLVTDIKGIDGLPADPDALLRIAYEDAKHVTGAGSTTDSEVYAILNGLLRDNFLPPDLEAAVFRAMTKIPGVTLETVNVFGRPAYSLAHTDDWLREELLLDPETYAYRGERSTVVHDATIDPLKAGNATGRIEKGHQVAVERVATAVVDEPGRRP